MTLDAQAALAKVLRIFEKVDPKERTKIVRTLATLHDLTVSDPAKPF